MTQLKWGPNIPRPFVIIVNVLKKKKKRHIVTKNDNTYKCVN